MTQKKAAVGSPAPDFSLPDQKGAVRSLKDWRGKWVILYFYPKDNTPGCTVEARGFRDDMRKFSRRGAVIVGVSKDSSASHKNFCEKENLPFTLLSDTEKRAIRAYGVWVKKKLYGKEYMGVRRDTFIIDPKGIVRAHYENVSPKTHSQEVLSDLDRLMKNSAR